MPKVTGFKEDLSKWLDGATAVVVAGIGNEIRRDDFIGVKIVRDLKGKVSEKVALIECETVPESFMDEISSSKPSHVLLVDAAMLHLKPGDVRLYDPCKILNVPAISTHSLPVRVFCDYITELTKARIALLLIEPRITNFGEGLSEEVAKTATVVVKTLLEILP